MTETSRTLVLTVSSKKKINEQLADILLPAGYQMIAHDDLASAMVDLQLVEPCALLIEDNLTDGNALEFAAEVTASLPLVPVTIISARGDAAMLQRAISAGCSSFVGLPLHPGEVIAAVRHSQQRRLALENALLRAQPFLDRQIREHELLAQLARSITASLELDSVLAQVVDAAVQLSGAEEGSLLLLDEDNGELYVRAARNFNDDFVRSFRLPIQDTLAGAVLRTGSPVLIDDSAPQKIKTSYLVHSLLYVPLQANGRTFGVLGVDNRLKRLTLNQDHVRMLSALADYAVIAIENARLFDSQSAERARLETILTHTQDGFIVMDADRRLVLVNHAARTAFGLDDVPLTGRRFSDVFTQPDLLEIIEAPETMITRRLELELPDGKIFSTLIAPIPEVGAAVTLHDITYLKKLDRMKSDFVSTVSHDLRSPLTAVLGYVELIERAGAVNDTQREFIRRVQGSVRSITSLVDDLVNLGRIESGFDMRNEMFDLSRIIQYAADGFKKPIAEHNHRLLLELPENLPPVMGNPVQIRQVIDHLLDNAIRYTPAGGVIGLRASSEDQQVIVQLRDTGIGIPPVDLPFIFDKFYRAENASSTAPGTGLGLAIVRSVIEAHRGRIWVDSAIGKGTEFTLVLPQAQSR